MQQRESLERLTMKLVHLLYLLSLEQMVYRYFLTLKVREHQTALAQPVYLAE